MATLGIIPARYASTRFPGKPLAILDGKTIIHRVYQQCQLCDSIDELIVATDDERIAGHVHNFGGLAVMTRADHVNGTSRCAEALKNYELISKIAYDVVINIQGDEPYIHPDMINKVVSLFNDPNTRIGTLVKRIHSEEELFNPNVVKVLSDKNNKAMIFSRNPMPYNRDVEKGSWLKKTEFYKHIGLYGFRKDTLIEVTKLKPSRLELAEKLEQLTWMENGYPVTVDYTDHDSAGIDTPEDLLKLTNKS